MDCGVNYFVSNNGGKLAGWGWSDSFGWVSFCGNSSGGSTWDGSTFVCPSSPTYEVNIDNTTGIISGWAWNDEIGWISFCGNASGGSTGSGADWSCPASPTYYVQTSWLPIIGNNPAGNFVSVTYDTLSSAPAYNSIMWRGVLPTDTRVKFQLATSKCSNGADNYPTCSTGTWNFIGSDGTNCGSVFWYESAPDTQINLGCASSLSGKRYFKYQAQLCSSADCETPSESTPTITGIIINWSP